MENNNSYYSQTADPLPMRRGTESLKAFAVLAKDRSVPDEVLKDKLAIGIIFAYSQSDALIGAYQLVNSLGRDVRDYITPYMIAERDLTDLIKIDNPTLQFSPEAFEAIQQPAPVETPIEIEKTKEKAREDMVSYMRFIVDTVGTPEEKDMAEAVISKFGVLNSSNPPSPVGQELSTGTD